MQINNWSDLLKSKRLAKTPRDLNNDLVIIGTNTTGSFKKQDTWQPYAMTLSDLAAAIGGGGGGGGVSFSLLAGDYTVIQENGTPITTPFIPAENSTITIGAVSVPNGLNWRGTWSNVTSNYVYNDVVSVVVGGVYYTYWMYNDAATPPAGEPLPSFPTTSNTYWAQLGLQGPAGAPGATGATGVAGFRNLDAATTAWTIVASGALNVVPYGGNQDDGSTSTDCGVLIKTLSANAFQLSIPGSGLSTVNFPIGYQVTIMQIGAGQVEIIPESGSDAQIFSANDMRHLRTQYSAATLVRHSATEWYLFGDLTNVIVTP